MKKIKHLILFMTLIMFSSAFYGQDITNLEKTKLEATVKQIVIKEVSENPIFKEFQVTNSTPVKFEKRISPEDYSYITDENDLYYGIKKGDVVMMITFYNGNNEEDFIIRAGVHLQSSRLTYVSRRDMMGFSGDALLNSK